jgi:hypothetical protein
MTMRLIRTLLQRPAIALLALAIAFAGWQRLARAQEFTSNTAQKTQQTPAGRIVWDHVGRVFLNPITGQSVYVGYLAGIDPIEGSDGTTAGYLLRDLLELRPHREPTDLQDPNRGAAGVVSSAKLHKVGN